MNKLGRYMYQYLLYGFPFVIALLTWGLVGAYFSPGHHVSEMNILLKFLNELLSYNFMLWCLTLIIYLALLVANPNVREQALRRLANLQERDEREVSITGKAARESYIATLGLTIFLLFFSIVNVNFSKLRQTDTQKPGHSVNFKLSYSFFNKSEIKKSSNDQIETIFETGQYFPSNATLLLIFLGWQLLVFNLTTKKEISKDI